MRKRLPHNQRAGLMQRVAVESLKREQSISTLIILFHYFDNNKNAASGIDEN